MATIPANQLFDAIADDMARVFEKAGDGIVDAIKKDLSVPVEITRGPRGGKVIIRSKRGEHPRKETGRLQDGVTHEVQRDGVNTSLMLIDAVVYSAYLDPPLDRPIFTGTNERFEEAMLDAAVKAIEGTPDSFSLEDFS